MDPPAAARPDDATAGSDEQGVPPASPAGEQPEPQTVPAPSVSGLAPPAPLREAEVQNAVSFLSHPKVRSSAESAKRSFLERKGLTAAEIQEAFRRVPPDTTPAVVGSYAPAPAAPVAQVAQPYNPPAASAEPPAKPFHTQPAGMVPPPQQQLVPAPAAEAQGVRWTQVVMGAALVAAGAYSVHNLLVPTMRGWYARWVDSRRKATDEAAEAAAANAKAIADAVAAQTAELRSTVDSLREFIAQVDVRRDAAASAAGEAAGSAAAAALRSELQAVAAELRNSSAAVAAPPGLPAELQQQLAELKSLIAEGGTASPKVNGLAGRSAGSLRRGGSGRWVEAAEPPLSGTQTDRFPVAPASRAGVQRAASPAVSSPTAAAAHEARAVSEFASARAAAGSYADMPPAPAPPPAGGMGPLQLGARGDQHAAPVAPGPGPSSAAAGAATLDAPPHPPSYMDVLQMLERGETPPGIRTDIDDAAPDPALPPSEGRLKPRAKPWDRPNTAPAPAAAAPQPSSAPAAATPPPQPRSMPTSPTPGSLPSDAALHRAATPPTAVPPPPTLGASSPSSVARSPSRSLGAPMGEDANAGLRSAASMRGEAVRGYGQVIHNGAHDAARTVLASLNPTPTANGHATGGGGVDHAGSSSGGEAAWRPPPLPQPSIKSGLARSQSGASLGSTAA